MVGSLQTVVVHTLIPVLRGRGRQISNSEATLVYRVSSRTAKVTQRNPVLGEIKERKGKKKKSKERKQTRKRKKQEKERS
jgi:hypothetical protein